MKFTSEASVKHYKDSRPNYAIWDENLPGFGFRVQAGGSKVYIVKYRVGNKQRMLKIGRVDQLSLVEAVKKAKAAFSTVADKVDPMNERAKAATNAGVTFYPAYLGFLEQLKKDACSDSYYNQNQMYLRTHFKKLHGMALSSIDKEVAGRELKVIEKRGLVTMNRARSAGSAFFSWAMREYNGVNYNPFELTNKNKEEARDRAFTDRELKTLWHKAPADQFGDIVRLFMLTMQRRTEIGGLPTKEFNRAERQLEIDATRSKNKKDSIIPLSDPAFAILDKYYNPKRKFIFGDNDTGYQGWSKSKVELDEKVALNKPWIFHDFRRTGKTRMEEDLDIDSKIIEAILNHSKKGLEKVYNGAKYVRQKRAALDKYADHLMAIVN